MIYTGLSKQRIGWANRVERTNLCHCKWTKKDVTG
jgi:hypothetical protein